MASPQPSTAWLRSHSVNTLYAIVAAASSLPGGLPVLALLHLFSPCYGRIVALLSSMFRWRRFWSKLLESNAFLRRNGAGNVRFSLFSPC
jgi:hypothetical protein